MLASIVLLFSYLAADGLAAVKVATAPWEDELHYGRFGIERELARATFDIYAKGRQESSPGLVPPPMCTFASPYFWLAMLDYSHYSGDTSFDEHILEGVLHRAGSYGDFIHPSRRSTTSHHDLALWGWLAMNGAERKFRNDEIPQDAWVYLANSACQFIGSQWNVPQNSAIGGLRFMHRWGEFPGQMLYADINGYWFALLARLARFTGSKDYALWAERVWLWMERVDLISAEHPVWRDLNGSMHLGPDEPYFDKAVNSETHAVLLVGAAYMYNMTNGDEKWENRIELMWNLAKDVSFNDMGILSEFCEDWITGCSTIDLLMKGQAMPHYALAIKVAPFLEERLIEHITITADAAAWACKLSGDSKCIPSWTGGNFSTDDYEMGNNIGALNAMTARHALHGNSPAPLKMEESSQFRAV